MIRHLAIAGMLLMPSVPWHGGGAGTPTNPPPTVHTNNKATAQAVKREPAPEDYYKPWDVWLKKHGSPISGQDVWVAQQETHIQGEVLICISYAETNLGKVAQRGSTTNVGSVGSYDQTNTTAPAESIRQGLIMIGKALNNQYLGRKTTLAQLTRSTEPYGAVYSESNGNWIYNVQTCLSRLKGRPIENQYQFRI